MSDIEVASETVVLQAAHDFASALAETPQFKRYEQAAFAFRKDQTAQDAMKAFQKKQDELRTLIMMHALKEEEEDELYRLRDAFTGLPIVREYFAAQDELSGLCQVIGDQLSNAIGFNYATVCGSSCCG